MHPFTYEYSLKHVTGISLYIEDEQGKKMVENDQEVYINVTMDDKDFCIGLHPKTKFWVACEKIKDRWTPIGDIPKSLLGVDKIRIGLGFCKPSLNPPNVDVEGNVWVGPYVLIPKDRSTYGIMVRNGEYITDVTLEEVYPLKLTVDYINSAISNAVSKVELK